MKNAWQTGLGVVTLAAMVVAVYMALVGAPTEAEQGMVQRIFYFHVPCAMVTFASFGLVAIAGALYLWLGSQIWDDLGYAAVEVGMVFCTLVLITGSIWAKPIWGAWWTWDSRLTTTFILWLIYGGYLLLRAFGGDTPQVARFAAVVGIIGALDVPYYRGIGKALAHDPSGGVAHAPGRTRIAGPKDGRGAADRDAGVYDAVHLAPEHALQNAQGAFSG